MESNKTRLQSSSKYIRVKTIMLFFPKQFLDLNTCLILALKLGTEKNAKKKKHFFSFNHISIIYYFSLLLDCFIFGSYIPVSISASSLLNSEKSFVFSWTLISCSNLSLVHLCFCHIYYVKIYIGYSLFLFCCPSL